MDELHKSLLFTFNNYINNIFDKISEDLNIDRHLLDKYIDNSANELLKINDDHLIVIPDISDDENLHGTDSKIDITKCIKITNKGKQCDYKPKPNSSYCGRHSNCE